MSTGSQYNKIGLFKIAYAVLILLILLIISIAGLTIDPESLERGPRNLPPKSELLQKWLSNEKSEIQSWKESDASDFGGFGWYDDDDQDPDPDPGTESITEKVIIDSQPGFRAIVNNTYTYTVDFEHVEGNDDNVVCKLHIAPGNANIEECVISWIPSEATAERAFAVIVYDQKTGEGQRQDFDVTVTESSFFLGTDNRGRDVLSLILLSSKWILLSGFIVTFIAFAIGLPLGAYSAFYDNQFSRMARQGEQLLESMPFIILIFIVAISTGFKIYAVMVVFGIFMAPSVSKIAYDKVHNMKKRNFIESAQELGVENNRILWNEIIWHNGRIALFVQIANLFAMALLLEVMLSYLQLGVRLPEMSLGILLYQGNSQLISGNLWLTVIPTVIIILIINAYYLFGDGLKTLYGNPSSS